MKSPTIPSTDDYVRALRQLEPAMPSNYREMLCAHYAMPGRVTTARLLAEAVGYENFNAANLHYGTLGRNVAEACGILHPRLITVSTLVEFVLGVTNNELLWVLRREVAEALEALGWVSPSIETLPLYSDDESD